MKPPTPKHRAEASLKPKTIKGFMLAEHFKGNPFRFDNVIGVHEKLSAFMKQGKLYVPCTISYQLPTPRTKKK